MAAMLHDSVVVVAVMCTRPQAMLLAMITMRKLTHGFPFLPYMSMGLCYNKSLIDQACLIKVNQDAWLDSFFGLYQLFFFFFFLLADGL